eukprot:364861-Chlamydomonas_euryale.AAC.3
MCGGFRVQGVWRVQGSGCVEASGFRVCGGLRVRGVWRVQGFGCVEGQSFESLGYKVPNVVGSDCLTVEGAASILGVGSTVDKRQMPAMLETRVSYAYLQTRCRYGVGERQLPAMP